MTPTEQVQAANFEGHKERECGEHRTVGSHRAWCYECTEWCYPELPCRGCEIPKLKGAFRELAEEFRRLARQHRFEADEEKVGLGLIGIHYGKAGAFEQAAQMLEERLNG